MLPQCPKGVRPMGLYLHPFGTKTAITLIYKLNKNCSVCIDSFLFLPEEFSYTFFSARECSLGLDKEMFDLCSTAEYTGIKSIPPSQDGKRKKDIKQSRECNCLSYSLILPQQTSP